MVFFCGKEALGKFRDRWLDQAHALFSEPSSDVGHEKIQLIDARRENRHRRRRFIRDCSLR